MPWRHSIYPFLTTKSENHTKAPDLIPLLPESTRQANLLPPQSILPRNKGPRMPQEQTKNPLHGITLETIVVRLQEHYGWDGLSQRINIKCFKSNPSVKSSLTFLRRTQWARDQVEALYVATFTAWPYLRETT